MSEAFPQALEQRLNNHNQQHLIRYWAELNGDEQQRLVQQIETLDLELIDQLFRSQSGDDSNRNEEHPADRARRAAPPSDLVRLPASESDRTDWQVAMQKGWELLSAGKVATVLVAGGQGTRLKFPHAKGKSPIGPVSQRTLFQILVEKLIAVSRRCGKVIPYFIMTSDSTHEETLAFFKENNYFGLDEDAVFFFQQGTMPAVDKESGRLLLDAKGRLGTSPDGHGGMLAAMANAGLLEQMRSRGIEYLFYHQVDNPTALVCDPALLGWHVLRNSEMTTKVASKCAADEPMGVVVDVDGKTQIVEYTDMPPDIAAKQTANGELELWAGNMAIHVFNREFLERLVSDELALPFNIAIKTVPHLDESGERVSPEEPNACKFERFIFDALPRASRALVVEADRPLEFNPVKNATGNDSPETARNAMIACYTQMLRDAGATVADDLPVEISPLFAMDAEALREKIPVDAHYTAPVLLEE